ncbi:ABC transporter substrate-binding protein [Thermomicrobium sp. CFH 73360]|uniref:ABC transporter substrate-binding protein n=1 Tax=Thermomicrobium sp. CFH 73360 TaxID=2951987 RepID=UPI002076E7A0|nr:ABC transporter substrate-binding protein [Thermomicrobium sp. CFH 73360]MCM8747404.1 ABC transporter substrate-binding protein [Thermomicrobium sp. CFH 73360]
MAETFPTSDGSLRQRRLTVRTTRRRMIAWGLAAGVLGSSALIAACRGRQQPTPEPTLVQTPTAATPAVTATTQPPQEASGRIIVGRTGDADTLDPHLTVSSLSWQVFTNIFDPLVSWNERLEVEGVLASGWEISEDAREYTFSLRDGIRFHDGTAFTADAVKFTFDRILDPQTGALASAWITALESVEVIDQLTVRMRLKEPFAPFLGNLCTGYFGIISPTAVQTYGDEFGKHPVGTGPWKFKEWRAGEEIVLERNPEYRNFRSYVENQGPPRVAELVFRTIPDEQTQIAAFETGEINVLAVPPYAVADFAANPEVQLFRIEQSVSIAFLEFHMEPPPGEYGAIFRPPFDDVRVRQAVAYGIDVDQIIATILEGLAVRNYGPLPTGVACYDPAIEQFGYRYDPQRAAQLLDEAGWTLPAGGSVRQKDGQPLQVTLWTWSATTQEKIAQVIQNQLNQLGFSVKLETLEPGSLLARLGTADDTSNFTLISWGWTEPHMLSMMTSTNAGIGLYRPEEYRRLVTEASRVVEHGERCRLYFEAMKIMLRDAAMVPLWSPVSVVAVRKEVQGFKIGPQGIYVYEDAVISG